MVDIFLKDPLSKKLQERLEKRASEKESWLSEWWNDAAYMGYRGRIIPNVSYFYTHKRGLGKGQSQEDRAAELIRATVEFKKLVDRWVVSFSYSIFVILPFISISHKSRDDCEKASKREHR